MARMRRSRVRLASLADRQGKNISKLIGLLNILYVAIQAFGSPVRPQAVEEEEEIRRCIRGGGGGGTRQVR